MGWVHGYKRHGAYLALAALALQIALSFGHVHLHGLTRAASHSVVTRSHATVVAQAPQQAPAQTPDDDDYCAICASIFLASTSFVATAPLLQVPSGFERIRLVFADARGVAEQRRPAFRSRAPPAV